jgi:serine/threonine-protein kinase
MLPSANFSPHSIDVSETSERILQRAKSLLALGLLPDEPLVMVGASFGDYEILEELGRGSSGVVYRARHAGIHGTVALKLMRDAQLASPREVQHFRMGAAAAAKLDHPHIVPVFHVGERDGRPFFTMGLIEGGNLQQALPDIRGSNERATRIMAKVARAVHYAHEQRVLHRDLKPANILLDANDDPHVVDFGLAKELDEKAMASKPSAIVGTLDYMAPEQAKAAGPLSPRADIYSLGVILYEMLTGDVPLPAGSEYDKLRWLASESPAPSPRETDPGVDRNLEVICLRCLHKTPSRRYRSAAELANALERATRPDGGDEPLPPLFQRLESRARRHPRKSFALACAGVLLLLASVSAWWVWQAQQRTVRETLETNAFIAGSQAGAALAQLREYAERIAQAARDPALSSLLLEGKTVLPATALQPHLGGFDSIALLTNDARVLAQWPSPDVVVFQRTFTFRDYFKGARYLAENHAPGAYVTPAFRSETKDRLVFAFSVPVLDQRRLAVGVLMATLNAKSVFGAVRMEDSAGGRHITSALLGPRGADRGTPTNAPAQAPYTFLVHPSLPAGTEHVLPARFSSRLRTAFGSSGHPGEQFGLQYVPPVKVADYYDAVPGFDGPWLAAFAPVGNTGFVVLVQTRHDAVLSWP